MRRKAPRVFAGTLRVVSGRNLVRQLESLSSTVPSDMDHALLDDLQAVITLPSVSMAGSPQPSDLAFDVVLQSYRLGSSTDLSLGTVGIPLYWRPRVRVAARLYQLHSNKTKKTFALTQCMSWAQYFQRILCWKVFSGLEPLARRSDMEILLRQAGARPLARLERAR
jgi:hypothetical protein